MAPSKLPAVQPENPDVAVLASWDLPDFMLMSRSHRGLSSVARSGPESAETIFGKVAESNDGVARLCTMQAHWEDCKRPSPPCSVQALQ